MVDNAAVWPWVARGVASLFLLLPAACGGGGTTEADGGTGGGSSGPPIIVPADPAAGYVLLRSTDAVTSDLGGVALLSDSGAAQVNGLTGTLDHGTGAVSVTDGTYTLNGTRSGEGLEGVQDGAGGALTATATGLTANYSYLDVVSFNYPTAGGSRSFSAIVGVATDPADMPTTGTAQYRGEAELNVAQATRSLTMKGQSRIDVDFARADVDVTLNGFSTRNQDNAVVRGPFDTLTITDARIAGNAFSGGRVQTRDGMATVDILGANPSSAVRGAFFGLNADDNQPGEVGGAVSARGDDGFIGGVFVGR